MRYNLPRLIAQRTKRRQFTFGTPDPLARDRDALLRIYLRVIRHWEGARGRLVEAYGQELDTMQGINDSYTSTGINDSVDDLQAAIDSEASWFSRIFLSLEVAIAEWSARLESWHRSKWRGSILSASGVDVDTMLYAGDVEQTVLASIKSNLNLIADVNEQQKAKMAEAIFRGLNQRMPAREVAKELQAITQFGRKRSLLIASVELQKISTALDTERMAEAGITQFVWRHSGKKHPREWHKARNGKRYDLRTRKEVGGDEVIPTDDMPGIPIRCFPSWQPANFHDDVFVAYRRWHSGHLTTLVTETGETLSATPNHPILTRDGWKAIEALNVGDYVAHASVSGLDRFGIDIVKVQPRIGDLFEACKAVFGAETANGLSGDFHGDATANEEIQIVNIERGLRNEIKSACSEGVAKLFLENAVPAFMRLARLGVGEPMPQRDGLSTNAIVRRLDLLEALCWRQISPDDVSGMACITDIHASLLESCKQRGAGYTMPSGDAVRAFSAFVGSNRAIAIELLAVTALARDMLAGPKVAPNVKVLGDAIAVPSNGGAGLLEHHAGLDVVYHRVENVVTRAWAGHVFNLQTDSGWYLAGSTGVVNCGCKKQAYFEIEGIDDDGNPV